MKITTTLFCGLLLGSPFLSSRSGAAAIAGETGDFDVFDIFIEINATDGDAGFQGKLDAEAWWRAWVVGPDGGTVWRLKPDAHVADQGATELVWESAEPEFDEDYTLEDFLDRFEEGTYIARAKTLEGGRLSTSDYLTHNLPAGPLITFPEEEDEIDASQDLVVEWEAVTMDLRGGPLRSDIVSYKVTVETTFEVHGEEVTEVLNLDVPADKQQATIPAEFLVPGREYKVEIGAQEESSNSTFTETPFVTV